MNKYSLDEEPLPPEIWDEVNAPYYSMNTRNVPICGARRDNWLCIADPHGLDPAFHYMVWDKQGVRPDAR